MSSYDDGQTDDGSGENATEKWISNLNRSDSDLGVFEPSSYSSCQNGSCASSESGTIFSDSSPREEVNGPMKEATANDYEALYDDLEISSSIESMGYDNEDENGDQKSVISMVLAESDIEGEVTSSISNDSEYAPDDRRVADQMISSSAKQMKRRRSSATEERKSYKVKVPSKRIRRETKAYSASTSLIKHTYPRARPSYKGKTNPATLSPLLDEDLDIPQSDNSDTYKQDFKKPALNTYENPEECGRYGSWSEHEHELLFAILRNIRGAERESGNFEITHFGNVPRTVSVTWESTELGQLARVIGVDMDGAKLSSMKG